MKLTTMIERLGPVLADAIYERFDEIGMPQEDRLRKDDVRGIRLFLLGKVAMWAHVYRRKERSKPWCLEIDFIRVKKLKDFS